MGYISKFGTHTNGNIIFIKPNEVPLVGNPPQSMSLNALHVRKLNIMPISAIVGSLKISISY